MKQIVKLTGLALMLVGALVLSGCGDDKKAEPQKPATTTNTTNTQKTTTNTQTPGTKLTQTEGPNWRYPSYIKYQEDTPKMTPEIQKIVDECYAQAKLNPSAKGKFLNDSKITSSDKRKVRDLWFHAEGVNHNRNNKFKNSKGKEVYQQEVYHIKFIVDKDTSAIKSWRFYKYVMNPEMPDGKTIVIKEVK